MRICRGLLPKPSFELLNVPKPDSLGPDKLKRGPLPGRVFSFAEREMKKQKGMAHTQMRKKATTVLNWK